MQLQYQYNIKTEVSKALFSTLLLTGGAEIWDAPTHVAVIYDYVMPVNKGGNINATIVFSI